MTRGLTVIVLLALTMPIAPIASAQDVERGEEVYTSRCVICHGDNGDGMGLVGIVHRAQANGLVTTIYPRDFTAGVFKFRSTPSGTLPTDDDLMRIVTEGISRSGMPSHTDMPEADRLNVISFIKTFSQRWAEDEPGEPLEIAAAPSFVGSAESTTRGEGVYATMQCFQCHGETGVGDGPASETLTDSWGDQILAFDFTSGPLKGGSTPEMIYRTFMTGLDGTPMPSYQPAMTEEQDRWDLVSYCLELMRGAPATQQD
ncbi:MAG TPA: cytochrome C [Acidobacteria bacterium]|jgi:mono/diheme cytochrome c family protein|nr:cytochrome C [Acidobacteriota bacterium]MDP6371258.1 c-type cytochrome [Vicinamibacterales bacterium]HAK55885.1 cytochrome C [Acidobacteriota bacterium]|tara:strand:+ start:4667 stop:5440 length:774 start_codon:yes stop_codon:yes gene_type:complete